MSETLRDLVVSLSLNSDNFTRNIKSINKQIQEAESAFRLASAGVENFETTTSGLSSKLSTLQRTFQLQQDAVGQYERALQQASDKLQECYTRQNDYAQRLTDAKDKQQQLKTEVASAAQAYKRYKNTLGETDSATIAAKANLDAYKSEYRAAVQEVKKLEGALERGQLGGQPRRGRLEILHTGGSEMKRRLCFLDLLVDGFDIACEIIAVQRQRYHEIAERLAHAGSPARLL